VIAAGLEMPVADNELEQQHGDQTIQCAQMQQPLGDLPRTAQLVRDAHDRGRRTRDAQRSEHEAIVDRHVEESGDPEHRAEGQKRLREPGRQNPGVVAEPARVDAVAELEQRQRERDIRHEALNRVRRDVLREADAAEHQPDHAVGADTWNVPVPENPFAGQPCCDQHQRPSHHRAEQIHVHAQSFLNGVSFFSGRRLTCPAISTLHARP
jgi:hypothetical protein